MPKGDAKKPDNSNESAIAEELDAIGAEIDCWRNPDQSNDAHATDIIVAIDDMLMEIEEERDRLYRLRDQTLALLV